VYGFELVRQKLKKRGGALAFVVPALIAAALLLEQVNFLPTHRISRREESIRFSKLSPPPKQCAEFYISNWSRSYSETGRRQTDAMLVAQQYGIATLNGYSSWLPPGWPLLTIQADVAQKANEWATSKGISSGLCSLDIFRGIWRPVAVGENVQLPRVPRPVEGKIANGGFEDGLDPWAPYMNVVFKLSTDHAHSGSQSLAQVEGAGSDLQDVSGLRPGQRYTIAAWVAASPGATASAYMGIYDPGAAAATLSNPVHPGVNWQLLSETVIVSQTGALRIHLFRGEGTGTIYWDDVSVYPEPLAGELANAGFEDGPVAWKPYMNMALNLSTDHAHSGSQSLAQVEGVGSDFADVSGLKPGERYTVSAWVAASPRTTASAYLGIWDPGLSVAKFSKRLHPGTNWQQLSQSVTVSNAGTLRIHLFRGQGRGTIYWDDIAISHEGGSNEAEARK
jgi:hypothetical protein